MILGSKKNYLILIFLIIALFIVNISISIKNKGHLIFPSPVTTSLNAIAISIDELINGKKGYIGNRDVLENLLSNHQVLQYLDCKKINKYCFVENINFKSAVETSKKSDKKPRLIYENEDIGLIDFYKFAFFVFGFNMFSLMSAYYLILFASLIIWVVYFYKETSKLFFPILFLSSHAIIIFLLPSFGDEIIVAHSRRFLPVLTIIPTIFIIVNLVENKFFSLKCLILNILQISILLFIFHSRSTALFQFLNISFIILLILILKRNQLRELLSRNKNFINISFSLIIILIFYKFLMFVNINPLYSKVVSKHLFWHAAYIGLSAHPDSELKYNIYNSDGAALDYVVDFTEKKYGEKNWKNKFGFEGYERILKNRYFEILKSDTSFYLYNYLMKPLIFLKLIYENILKKILLPLLIFFILLRFILHYTKLTKFLIFENKNFYFVFITLIFSFIPSLFLLPSLVYSLTTILLSVLLIIYVLFRLTFFKLRFL